MLNSTYLLTLEGKRRDSSPKHGDHESEYGNEYCLTPQCVQLSADILRSRGNADPCDDFYDCLLVSTRL